MEDPFEKLRKENRELRDRNQELFEKYADATLALGLVTGHFPPFNEITRQRAQGLIYARKAEWEARPRSAVGQSTGVR
jgi:hypothetical protein